MAARTLLPALARSALVSDRLIALRYPAERLAKAGQRRAVARLRRWGSPALLLAWLPVVGDPLCLAAGWLRMSFWLSLLFIAVGKVARYAAILLLAG